MHKPRVLLFIYCWLIIKNVRLHRKDHTSNDILIFFHVIFNPFVADQTIFHICTHLVMYIPVAMYGHDTSIYIVKKCYMIGFLHD